MKSDTTDQLQDLVAQLRLKKAERDRVTAEHHEIEARVLALSEFDPNIPGTRKVGATGLKATVQMRYSVDQDKLRDLAQEHDGFEHLGVLFDWQPKLKKRAWDSTTDEVRAMFSDAIESKAGKPSFAYSEKKEEE